MIKIICNRCNREIKEHGEDVGYISLGINVNPLQGIRENEIYIQGGEFGDWHFCPECMNEIKDFIKNQPDSTLPEQKTETVLKPEKTEQKSRKRIDIGKIVALKNAGWSVAKIADEMGMQPQSVSNALYQYKKKQSEGA